MDVFWLIPAAFIVVPFVWGFYMLIKRRPLSPSHPNVLVHKTSDQPLIDPADERRDWSGRPCGAFLAWLEGRSE